MRIYKTKKSPYWYISFSISGNRFRFSSQTTKKSLAEALGKKVYDEKWNEIHLGIKVFNLFDVINYYLSTGAMNSLSKARVYQNKLTIKLLLEYFEYTTFDTKNFYIFLNKIKADRKLADNTLNKYIQSTNSIINYAITKGFINENPLKNLSKSHLAKDIQRVRFLSLDEFKVLSKLIRGTDIEDYILFAMNSGLRLGEQLNLTWDRVDYTHKEIYIIETKTKRNRTFPLNPVLEEILKKREHLKQPFILSKSTLDSRWHVVLNKANINNFRWHDLRHTFASWCLKGWFNWQKNKIDLYRLSKLLGHSKINMTERYAHLQIDDLKKDIKDY